ISNMKTNKKSILIVEDDPEITRIYQDILGDRYELTMTDTTKKAMNQMSKKTFDLMILDIILPVESGEQFYERIKEMKKFKNLKVLVVTVLGNGCEFFRNIDPSARCLPKPFEIKELVKTIQSMIS
ncbi:MAG: response regulator, partial [Nanoarchaeota archaeon]|nr:response regulator [Nanoarchaeota archaeon]